MGVIRNREKYFLYIFRIVAAVLLATVFSIISIVYNFSYDEIIKVILKSFHMEAKLGQFKTSFLTENKFLYLKLSLLFFASLLFFLILKAEKVFLWSVSIFRGIEEILVEIKKTLIELSLIRKVTLVFTFIFIIAFRIFYFYKFPLFIDEATSYIYFVSPGFLISASYYSGPNNHVFYSELCALVDLFFDDPLIIMRLPSLIVSLALCLLLFISANKYFGFFTALLTLILFSFSDPITFYSIQGRGYTLLAFFAFVSSLSLVKYLFQRKDIFLFLFIISSTLGFYTIPVFLYPFLSLAIFTLYVIIRNQWWGQIFRFFLIFGLVALLVVLLYLPILLFNDFKSIMGNPWIAPSKIFLSDFFPYLLRVNNYLWNWEIGALLTLIGVTGGASFLWINNKKDETIFGLIFLCVPLLVIIIQHVIPFERVWLYLFLPLSFGLSYFLVKFISAFVKNPLIRNISIGTLILFTSVIMLVSGIKGVLSKSFGYYKEMNALTSKIYNAGPATILAEDYDCNTFIKYKYLLEKKPVDVRSSNSPSFKFDMIVTSRGLPYGIDSSMYVIAFSNPYVKAYRIKQ